jgi:hypothetical protein
MSRFLLFSDFELADYWDTNIWSRMLAEIIGVPYQHDERPESAQNQLLGHA